MHRVLLRAGLTRAGQSSLFGQMGWIGRPWLARPSKGHDAKKILGIFYCSTGQKGSRKHLNSKGTGVVRFGLDSGQRTRVN